MPATPASMLRTKRSWPGTSTKPTRGQAPAASGRSPGRWSCRALLLGQAVGVDAGEACTSVRLAMVDVAGGGDDHGGAAAGPGAAARCSWSTKRASSSRQRRSSHRRRRPCGRPPAPAGPQRGGQGVERPARPDANRRAQPQRSAGQAIHRQRAAADLAHHGSHDHRQAHAQPAASEAVAAAQPGRGCRPAAAPAGAAWAGAGQAVGIGRYRRSTCFQRGQRQLVERSARLSGCLRIRRPGRLAADDQPGLRPAQQLVAAEGDQVGAGGQRSRGGRLVRQAPVGARSTSAPLPRSTTRAAVGMRRAAPARAVPPPR
jgi:hypothetical protein